MIWLKDFSDDLSREIVTCNMIGVDSGKIERIEELKDMLKDTKRYILTRASSTTVDKRELDSIFLGNGEYIRNEKIIDITDKSIYLQKVYCNPMFNSFNILMQCGAELDKQELLNINLLSMFNNDLFQVELLESIFTNMNIYECKFLMNSLWPDFNFFASQIIDAISFREISRYDMRELMDIDRLCKKNKIQSEVTDVLKSADMATSNSRVLKLARIIKDKCD